jgi:hypothetical protein
MIESCALAKGGHQSARPTLGPVADPSPIVEFRRRKAIGFPPAPRHTRDVEVVIRKGSRRSTSERSCRPCAPAPREPRSTIVGHAREGPWHHAGRVLGTQMGRTCRSPPQGFLSRVGERSAPRVPGSVSGTEVILRSSSKSCLTAPSTDRPTVRTSVTLREASEPSCIRVCRAPYGGSWSRAVARMLLPELAQATSRRVEFVMRGAFISRGCGRPGPFLIRSPPGDSGTSGDLGRLTTRAGS